MIAATNDLVYIGSDLPKEYSGSNYTNSLKGANARAKANAATGISEMIEISVGKHFRENRKKKHKRDAKNGWYRYDSIFALMDERYSGQIEKMQMHLEDVDKDLNLFENITEEFLFEKVFELVQFFLHDEYNSKFRKLLTTHQFIP